MDWASGTTWFRNPENINRATNWARARQFIAAIPTFRTVNGKRELIAFDNKFVAERDFGAGDNSVPWGALTWPARTLSISDTAQLLIDDRQTVDWLHVTTTAARAVQGAGYLAAFPKVVTDLPAKTSLQFESDKLPFHIYAFKPSAPATRGTVPHLSLNAALFTNLGVMESPLAGFHSAVHEYAMAQGHAAGIPTWWIMQGTTPTIGDDILDPPPFDANTVHQAVVFAKGDGYRRRISEGV